MIILMTHYTTYSSLLQSTGNACAQETKAYKTRPSQRRKAYLFLHIVLLTAFTLNSYCCRMLNAP